MRDRQGRGTPPRDLAFERGQGQLYDDGDAINFHTRGPFLNDRVSDGGK